MGQECSGHIADSVLALGRIYVFRHILEQKIGTQYGEVKGA